MELKGTKEEILKKAEELGIAYEAKYKGCCQSTYLAIIDALRWGGFEILPEDIEYRLYPGISALTAGVCMTGEGTCGAVTSSVMLMGLAFGMSVDTMYSNIIHDACTTIKDNFLDKYYQEYGSILCKEIQRKYYGKAWDLTRIDMTMEFLAQAQGCIIAQSAKWATEIILNELEEGNIILPDSDR